jgi:hypothetical protein
LFAGAAGALGLLATPGTLSTCGPFAGWAAVRPAADNNVTRHHVSSCNRHIERLVLQRWPSPRDTAHTLLKDLTGARCTAFAAGTARVARDSLASCTLGQHQQTFGCKCGSCRCNCGQPQPQPRGAAQQLGAAMATAVHRHRHPSCRLHLSWPLLVVNCAVSPCPSPELLGCPASLGKPTCSRRPVKRKAKRRERRASLPFALPSAARPSAPVEKHTAVRQSSSLVSKATLKVPTGRDIS